MILKLTDSTNEITLSPDGSLVLGCTYFPRTPEDEAQRWLSGRDGESLGDVRMKNIVESAEVILEGSAANIRAKSKAIQRFLDAARLKQKAIWVAYAPLDGEMPSRSRIVNGRLIWPEQPGRRRLESTLNTVSFVVLWERLPRWLASEIALQVSAQGQAASTSGRVIYNAADNWFEVDATNLDADLASPVRITLANTTGEAIFYRDFYIGSRISESGDPAFVHFLEGEDGSGAGSVQNAGDCSGGQYRRVTFSGSERLTWTLANTVVEAGNGRLFKPLLRLAGATGGPTRLQPLLLAADGLTTLWAGDEVTIPGTGVWLLDLGRAMPLPPGGSGAWGDMVFGLDFRAPVSSTVDIDFVQLSPTDTYRHIIQRAQQVSNGASVVFDYDSRAYWVDGSSRRHDVYAVDQAELTVLPGYINRFHLLFNRSGNNAVIDDEFTIRVYCQPARKAV